MRRSRTQSLAEALSDYIAAMRIGGKLKEVSVTEAWPEIVGRAIASKTSSVRFKDGRLYVVVKSSVVRNELIMIRESLRQRINESMGEDLVKEIVIR